MTSRSRPSRPTTWVTLVTGGDDDYHGRRHRRSRHSDMDDDDETSDRSHSPSHEPSEPALDRGGMVAGRTHDTQPLRLTGLSAHPPPAPFVAPMDPMLSPARGGSLLLSAEESDTSSVRLLVISASSPRSPPEALAVNVSTATEDPITWPTLVAPPPDLAAAHPELDEASPTPAVPSPMKQLGQESPP